ncbi:capsular polysaccharide biosynthesis protein [uncultured Pelagimonas sp.]|uniref:capsular polysaccharide biosynthesis protein n=1 Tax=uncultured Pelagimonas sp. TaxID=1618102 RepID=UPI00261E61DC|nr:capsular polysaccharide biosynthesis protein [uncultured Pelagimonas sp.]
MSQYQDHNAGEETSRRLYVYNGGFFTQKRVRLLLHGAGYRLSLGLPKAGDLVGVWGQSPTSHRGEAIAAKYNAPIVRIEDAFLRSLHPGRAGEPPIGLMIDETGLHFDPAAPSDLETLLKTHPLDDGALMARARAGIARMQEAQVSKYSACDPDISAPDPGYVLVVDQTQNDAAVRASKGDRSRFLEMLFVAQEENPRARIVIKTHPETAAGYRAGHYRSEDATGNIEFFDAPISPWRLLEGATKVYTLSSQMGFEAILAGHKPRVFGGPFYAGWGLTDDEDVFARRRRPLSRAQMFAAAMILYPRWFDPYSGKTGSFEDALGAMEAQLRAWTDDRKGWVASGMRLWKRAPLQAFFGSHHPVCYEDTPTKVRNISEKTGRRRMAWAGKAQGDVVRVEDGFVRSRGLGAELTPPLSLVLDDLGIYYDPTAPSRLEDMIQRVAKGLRPDQIERIERIRDRLLRSNLSKYNLSGELPTSPPGHRILVPGQVEGDASILRGSPDLQSNTELLRKTREANPDAVVLWKPHPDVVAGLRKGHVEAPEEWADMTLENCNISEVLKQVDEVWTMTSLTGFEALTRSCRVTTFGAPFYAGWGVTRDLGRVPARRLQGPRPDLNALMYAVLVDYPRYYDPIRKLPCPIETVLERLETGNLPSPGPFNRSLSKLQGALASQAHLWRR